MSNTSKLRVSAVGLWLVIHALLPGSAIAQENLSLKGALERAFKQHSDLAIADLEVRLARIQKVRAALRRVRVRLDGRWSEQRERRYVGASAELCAGQGLACGGWARARVVDASAQLELPLWTGMALEAEWARARHLERASLAERRARRLALTLEVTRAYWTVRWMELLRQSARQALERRVLVAASIKARFGAGIAPRTDQGRAQTAMLRQRAQLSELEGRLAEARADLGAALELDPSFVLTDDPPAAPPPLPSLALALDQARRQRPELEAAGARTAAQDEQARIVRGALWPEVSLFARAEARNELLGIPQPDLIRHYSAGLLFSWLSLDGLATWQDARAAELDRQKAGHQGARIAQLVDAEVRRAHGQLAAALAERAPLLEAQAIARDTVTLIQRRYQAGAALLIEVLDAEDELAELDAAAAGNAVDIAVAQAALASARGQS
jgi:outer membrane protein TolC